MLKSSCFTFSALILFSNFWLLSHCEPASASVFSFSQFAFELGYGTGIENTRLLRADCQLRFNPRIANGRGLELIGIGQLSTGLWRGDRDIVDASATPILRLQPSSQSANLKPYIEAAIGFHYISDIQMRNRVFSTNFQFGDHLGLGVVFGRSRSVDISYQFQHLSNASIKRPNSGINFHIVRIGYSF